MMHHIILDGVITKIKHLHSSLAKYFIQNVEDPFPDECYRSLEKQKRMQCPSQHNSFLRPMLNL